MRHLKSIKTLILVCLLFIPTTIFAAFDEGDSSIWVRIGGGNGCYKIEVGNESQTACGVGRYFVEGGSEVKLTAIPNEGYRFNGWYGFTEVDTDGQGTMEYPLNANAATTNIVYTFTIGADEYRNLAPVFVAGVKSYKYNLSLNEIETTREIISDTIDLAGYISERKEDFESSLELFSNGKDEVVIPNYNGLFTEDSYAVITDIVAIDNTGEPFEYSNDYHASSGTVDDFDNLVVDHGYVKKIETYSIEYITISVGQADLTGRDADQVQIWLTNGGQIAVEYTPSNPNVRELETRDGNDYSNKGEIVQFYQGDAITAKARALEGYRFVGWKHANMEYDPSQPETACTGEVFATTESYTYTPNVTVVDGDSEPLRYVCAAFELNNSATPTVEEITEVNLTIEIPSVGDLISVGNGGDWDTQNPQATITLPKSAHYVLAGNENIHYMYYLRHSTDELFEGIFQNGETYDMQIWLESEENYLFANNVTVTINGTVASVIENDEGESIGIVYSFASSDEEINYTLEDASGNQILFHTEDGRVLVFNSTELTSLTDEELALIAEAQEIGFVDLKEQLNNILSNIRQAIGNQGTLLKVFDFSISDAGNNVNTADNGFTIRIKITDDIKDFESLRLVYVKDDFSLEEPIILTKNGDYFEGTLNHLSVYALMNYNPTSSNPTTGDNILTYVLILGICVIGFVGAKVYLKRKYN